MTVTIQKPAPHFQAEALVNGEFKTLQLEDFKGKYLVLFFYPLDWTLYLFNWHSVCPTEIIAFSDKAKEFRKIGCEVVGCSVDSKFSHFNWNLQAKKEGGLGGLDIPLLSGNLFLIQILPNKLPKIMGYWLQKVKIRDWQQGSKVLIQGYIYYWW